MLRIGWFSTGRDQEARDLLATVVAQAASRRLECSLSYVFCNRAPGETAASDAFHQVARQLGLHLLYYSSSAFAPALRQQGRQDEAARRQWRLAYDVEVDRIISPYPVDVIVLAGYMLVIGPELCQRYQMLNLHPALPGGPIGTWQEVVWQLLLTGADAAGAMMHLVTPELDRGPAVTYFSFPLRGPIWDDLWQSWHQRKPEALAFLAARGRGDSPGPEQELFWAVRRAEARRELPLLVLTLDLLARGMVRPCAGKVLDREGRELVRGYCLNQAIEAWLAGGEEGDGI
jgi:phosphoribosylglycinamide formyltransferase-1